MERGEIHIKLRKRQLAKLYGCRYKRCNDGYWSLTLLDGSYSFSSYRPVSNEDFMIRLKWYRRF